jgi:hypothetical protein
MGQSKRNLYKFRGVKKILPLDLDGIKRNKLWKLLMNVM